MCMRACMRVPVCTRLGQHGWARKVRRAPQPVLNRLAPLSFSPSPHLHPSPFLASTMFANTLSSSLCPAWLRAQTEATTLSGSSVAGSQVPAHTPSAPAVATRCCLVGGLADHVCLWEMTPRTPGLWVPAKGVRVTVAILGSQWGACE